MQKEKILVKTPPQKGWNEGSLLSMIKKIEFGNNAKSLLNLYKVHKK